jgi:hypothetical protein
MSRFVVPQRTGLVAGQQDAPSGPLDRIVKYVPTEIVAVFTMFVGLVATATMDPLPQQQFAVGLIVLFFFTTVGYIWTRAPAGKVRNAHLLVSPLSFLAWAYPISSSLLHGLYIGLAALGAQALVLALALVVVPSEPT